jgi:hypothetical protein
VEKAMPVVEAVQTFLSTEPEPYLQVLAAVCA